MTQTSQSLALTNNQLALAVSNPGALGTIEAYISAVNRLPLLSQEQETTLGRRLRDESDLDAARQLITSHLRLVVSIARQYLGRPMPISSRKATSA
jgi:RNA polymerase sigma-32 factor